MLRSESMIRCIRYGAVLCSFVWMGYALSSCVAPVRPYYFKTARVERPTVEPTDDEIATTDSEQTEPSGGTVIPQRRTPAGNGGADNAEIDLSRPANTPRRAKTSGTSSNIKNDNTESAENILMPKRKTGNTVPGSRPSDTKSNQGKPLPSNDESTVDDNRQFKTALTAFDAGNYAESQKAFDILSRTLPSNDSLKYEAAFMVAESQLMQSQLDQGVQRLQALLQSPATPPGIIERALLRQGQVYCLQGNSAKATESFRQFRQRFPRSRYARLADCSAVRGS